MNTVTKEELNEKLKSLGIVLNDGVSMAKLYPVLKQATSSSPQPTPGYVYHVLIDFSFRGKKNAELLGDYLTKRLSGRQRQGGGNGSHNNYGVLKTLKSLDHLVQGGSRHFRNHVRNHDDEIRSSCSNFSISRTANSGNTVQDEIRELADKVLRDLFNEDLIQRDNDSQCEDDPPPEMRLSGLGSMGSSTQGFGNVGRSPSSSTAGSLTAQILDVVEKIVHAPDPKQEMLQSCLQGHVGEYKPATVESDQDSLQNKRTGHSWYAGAVSGSYDDGAADVSDDEDMAEFCGLYAATTTTAGDVGSNAESYQQIAGSREFTGISRYCKNDAGLTGLEDFDRLQKLLKELESGHKGNILHSIQCVLSTESGSPLQRGLVLLERLVARSLVPPPAITCQALRTVLEMKRLEVGDQVVATKTSKILASLEFLKDYKL